MIKTTLGYKMEKNHTCLQADILLNTAVISMSMIM